MPTRAFRLIVVMAWLIAAPAARAQEGHPLTGTWAGDWGPNATDRTHVTMVMTWDGTRVNGLINPGPNAVPLTGVSVDWENWTVRIEADTKDASGAPVRIAAEGRLDDIGSYHRTLTGTWTQGSATGEFRLTRE
jgi:hypothetical protein